MNLESCTPGQREIVTTLDAPLMVSAGAGSGKTFTLTQRIAYALDASEGIPFAQGIDQVMAITFTKKAAAELKSRIKRLLCSLDQEDEALRVDNAWISTIHGMCARVLREHALELGIDPGFEVIGETDAGLLYDEAFDEVINITSRSGSALERELLAAMPVRSGSSGETSVESLVTAVTGRACALPAGFDALASDLPLAQPSSLVRQLVELGHEFCDCSSALSKPTKTDGKHRAAMEHALEVAQAYLSDAPEVGFCDDAFDAHRFAEAVFSFPKTSKSYRSKEDDPGFFATYREEFSSIGAEAEAGLAAREQVGVVAIAHRVAEAFARRKGPTQLDNNDLLRAAYHALSDNPAIASSYRSRFRLIMIDEFQDTDELQVAIVSALAAPGFINVCTVGDAQQSIYRFRGADVNVFFDYRAHLEAECPNARFVSLPDNFRSHADILSFVDRIFSQPAVFGDRFLSLSPKGTVNHKPDPIFIDRPRIEAALFDTRVGGPGLGEARRRSAQRIAEHFASLREAGIAPGDMALLLGSMSSVGVYAEALRMTGFECLVSGGSTFSASPEVQLVGNILRLLSSRYDDAALYEVLSSPLFSVSDDAFVCLATRRDAQGRVHRRTLSQGLYAWERERDLCGLTEEKRDNLDFAHLCLDAARRSAARAGQTAGIRDLIRASGWFVRLERQGTDGQAIVGNVYKALRMVERLEAQGLGPARLADRFVADCESLKLTPGTLSTTSSDFVTIMTVHASKGLEFPHVAVAELRMNGSNAQLTAENVGGQTYLALRPRSIQPWRQTADGLRQFSAPFDGTAEEVVEARTPGERHWALKAYERTQETAEARRLLYVALTRASKSLFLGLVFRGNKDNRYIDVMSDLWSALEWDPNPEARVQLIEYGGSAPMRLEYIRLDTPGEESVSQLSDEQPFLIPAHPLPKPVYSQPLTGGRANVCSYTSLHDEEPLRRANNPDEEFFEALAVDPESDATALGLAFHRLAQYAICEGRLVRPCSEAVDAQVRLQGLTPTQATRLDAALSRWFDSGCASELLGSHGMAQAEVPFMVHLAGGIMGERFLEGEIDALAVDNEGIAWLVDYKTGGTPFEAPAEIEQKHLLQAQCYAYALLCEGYQEVRCAFVRVEQDDAAHPGWPQVQEYRFVSADRQALETMLLTRMAEVSVAGR